MLRNQGLIQGSTLTTLLAPHWGILDGVPPLNFKQLVFSRQIPKRCGASVLSESPNFDPSGSVAQLSRLEKDLELALHH